VTTSLFFTALVLPAALFALLYFPALKLSLMLVSSYPKANLRMRMYGAAIDGLLVTWCGVAWWHTASVSYVAAAFLYLCFRDSFGGQSIGKFLVGQVVIHVDTGRRCSVGGSMRRNLLLILPGANLVAVILEARTMARDPQGQRLGDRLAHTQVVEGLGARDVIRDLQQWWVRFLAELPAAGRPDRVRPERVRPTRANRVVTPRNALCSDRSHVRAPYESLRSRRRPVPAPRPDAAQRSSDCPAGTPGAPRAHSGRPGQ
jgi:hypothetical protein